MLPAVIPRCVLLSLGLALWAAACSERPPEAQPESAAIQRFTGPTMGSTYEVKFVGSVPLPVVQLAVTTELAEFDTAFSKWRSDSEIVRCNQHRSPNPLAVSPRFAAVLQQALVLAAATDGAFDPTVEPLLALYREAKREGRMPEAAALDAAKARVDYRAVRVVDGAVVKARPDMELDLDGIVAGAAADALAARFDALGITAYYLEITGEVFCRGEKAPGQPWVIGVADPRGDAQGAAIAYRTVALRDAALCTSGDYRNALTTQGARMHHVFDPRTGRSAAKAVVSASVIADTTAVADALGTACLVLGADGVQSQWAKWQALGARAVLLLAPGEDGGFAAIPFDWPDEPR